MVTEGELISRKRGHWIAGVLAAVCLGWFLTAYGTLLLWIAWEYLVLRRCVSKSRRLPLSAFLCWLIVLIEAEMIPGKRAFMGAGFNPIIATLPGLLVFSTAAGAVRMALVPRAGPRWRSLLLQTTAIWIFVSLLLVGVDIIQWATGWYPNWRPYGNMVATACFAIGGVLYVLLNWLWIRRLHPVNVSS